MKIVFRVDASAQMGIGHLIRCLTLAEVLLERDVQIQFICREHAGNLIALLKQKAMPVTMLANRETKDTTHSENYADWLGVSQAADAEQTIEALNGERPDWLVVDHYGLDVEWEQRLCPYVSKIMVIDDLPNRHHVCDVLLDQNYSVEGERRYAGLIPDKCKLLVGPRYALLRPEYPAYRKTLSAHDGQVRKVLVFFGGTDPKNLTGLALEALSHSDLRHLEVDVVVGANNPHRNAIKKQVLQRQLTTLYGTRPHLADLMAQADLALGAGGATTWERMCLGLPTVVISFAENQRPASKALAAAKLIDYAGHFPDIKTDQLTQLLKKLSHDTENLTKMHSQNQLQVDGLGALRLAEVIRPSAANDIYLRPACGEDIVLYWNWANDPEVRKNAVNTLPIPWAMHQAWFEDKCCAVNSQLFVLEAAGLPVGQIRFEKEGGEALIDYSLDSIVRGRGWGHKLIALGAELIQTNEPLRLRAYVKDGNDTSAAVFLRMGFVETSSVSGADGLRSFYRNPDRSGSLSERVDL